MRKQGRLQVAAISGLDVARIGPYGVKGGGELLTRDGPRESYETPLTIAEGLALYSEDHKDTKEEASCRVVHVQAVILSGT